MAAPIYPPFLLWLKLLLSGNMQMLEQKTPFTTRDMGIILKPTHILHESPRWSSCGSGCGIVWADGQTQGAGWGGGGGAEGVPRCTSADASMRRRSVSTWPFWAANVSAVHPSPFRAWTYAPAAAAGLRLTTLLAGTPCRGATFGRPFFGRFGVDYLAIPVCFLGQVCVETVGNLRATLLAIYTFQTAGARARKLWRCG